MSTSWVTRLDEWLKGRVNIVSPVGHSPNGDLREIAVNRRGHQQVTGAVSTIALRQRLIGTASFAPEATFQVTTLLAGENNTCALAYDRENNLFIGCNTTPAQIIKVDATTLKRCDAITLPVGASETRVAAMIAISPEIILHGSYTNPFVITRIDGRTMTVTGQLTGLNESVTDKFVRPMVFDGEFVYIGCDSAAGKVVKIDPFTMTRVGGVTFGVGINNIMSMVYLNGYIYCGCETTPAYIVKVNPRTMAVETAVQLAAGCDVARAMTTDGRYLYIGCFTSPVKVVKFDPVTMAPVLTYTAGAGENQCYSMTTDGQYIYVGTWVDPGTFIQLNPVDMTRVSALVLNPGFPSDLMYLEPYFYTSCDTQPGRVLRFLGY